MGRAAADVEDVAAPVEEPPPPKPTPAYVRFARERLKFGSPPEPTAGVLFERHADLTEDLSWSSEMMGSGGWKAMLDWVVSALDADGAFIVDSRGLVVAASGLLGADVVEETGARLIIAFEQGDLALRSHGKALSVTVELESGWLVGMRVPVRDDDAGFIVGIAGPLPLTHEARRKIAAEFTKKALGV